MGPSQPSQDWCHWSPSLADQTYAIRGLHAPHCLLAPVSRLPSPSPMTDCVPAQGSTSLRSRLSEVYNSLKVCLHGARAGRTDQRKHHGAVLNIYTQARLAPVPCGASTDHVERGDPVMAQSPLPHRGPSLSLTITRAMSHPSSARCSMRMRSRTRSRSSTLAPPPLTTSPRTSPDGPPHLFCSIACGRRGGPGPLASSHCPVARSDATARAEALDPAAHGRAPRCWGASGGHAAWPGGGGLGLVVSLVAGVPLLWQAGPLPRLPSSPPPHSAHTAAALLGAAAPAAPPVAEARPPAQSQTPAARRASRALHLGAPPHGRAAPAPPCVCGTERGIPQAPGHSPAARLACRTRAAHQEALCPPASCTATAHHHCERRR